MNLERAQKITAARRELAKLESQPPAENDSESLSPKERFDSLFNRVYNMKGGRRLEQDLGRSYMRGLVAEIVAEDGSKLSLWLSASLSDRDGGNYYGGDVRGISAQWQGDGNAIGDPLCLDDEYDIPTDEAEADESFLHTLTELEETASAAEFMTEASQTVARVA